MSIILDLIGISWLLLLIREQCKKGHITLACILGILYSCIMMILAVPGPKWIFIIVSVIFVICTIRLILNESYCKWKDFWIEQSNEDGIDRNLSFVLFVWVKVAFHFIEKHKPSRLSNFQIPDVSTAIHESSEEDTFDKVEADNLSNIPEEDEEKGDALTSESANEIQQETPTSDNMSNTDESIDFLKEADIVEESVVSDEFVDL